MGPIGAVFGVTSFLILLVLFPPLAILVLLLWIVWALLTRK